VILSREINMNDVRGWCRAMTVIVLTAFAFPAVAAKGSIDKVYSLTMKAAPDYTATNEVIAPVKVTAQIKNEAPPSTASSNIGSFVLQLKVPGVTIVWDDAGHPPTPDSGTAVATATSITVTNTGPVKGGQTFNLVFYVTSCGDAKWDANVFTGTSLNGDTFKRKNLDTDPNLLTNISCGSVACGGGFTVDDVTVASLNPLLDGVHGAFNQDGTCGPVSYFVSNMLVAGKRQVHFRWPASDGPKAAFRYQIVSSVNQTPRLAWLNANGSIANHGDGSDVPAYINAPQCLSGQLPAPYGSLSQSVTATADRIRVDTSTPAGSVIPVPVPFAPFPIVIGAERMEVTGIQNANWSVTRTSGVRHPAGALVMSTPLPVLNNTDDLNATLADDSPVTNIPPPYLVGDQAQACIVGSPLLIPGDPNAEPPIPDTWLLKFLDIGDAWVRLPG
jgi:hypothetical protein